MKNTHLNTKEPLRWYKNIFFWSALVLLAGSAILCLIIPRVTIHIWVNRHHVPVLDSLFKIWTWLGDGIVALGIVIIFFLIRIRFGMILLVAYILSGLLSQIFKRFLFHHFPRPVKYFDLNHIDYNLYLVPGVDIHAWNSFPSGHTATAFGVFFGISLFLRSTYMQILLLILAVGVGYSRMYLSQHFLMDVTGGAFLGMISGYVGWWWLNQYDRKWLQTSVIKYFRS